jgi:hypothetical protein
MKMFEKEIDELYGLCKRVAHEVPDAFINFNYSSIGLTVYGTKNKKELYERGKCEFQWDMSERIYNEPELKEYSLTAYKTIKEYLLGLLIDGKCPHE